jgi:hypothetical protein
MISDSGAGWDEIRQPERQLKGDRQSIHTLDMESIPSLNHAFRLQIGFELRVTTFLLIAVKRKKKKDIN